MHTKQASAFLNNNPKVNIIKAAIGNNLNCAGFFKCKKSLLYGSLPYNFLLKSTLDVENCIMKLLNSSRVYYKNKKNITISPSILTELICNHISNFLSVMDVKKLNDAKLMSMNKNSSFLSIFNNEAQTNLSPVPKYV